jgi:FkbM family methyltransferase
MKNKTEEIGLPVFRDRSGREVFHYAASETKFVYKEIFEDRVYLRHGITLSKGNCVWDVGANIGLFAVFVQENFEDVQVHSFEPSPEIYKILTANTAQYGQRVVAHCCGIAGKEGEATFTFYPNYSIMSGFHADHERDGRTLRAGILQQWSRRYPGEPSPEERFLDDMTDSALARKQEIVCPLRTISQLIEETHTQAIDLLKIDAEGSELDILSGIRDDHWPAIRQIVMEIHDGEGSVATPILKLLAERGFQVTVEEEPGLSGSGVVNCYAVRPSVSPIQNQI